METAKWFKIERRKTSCRKPQEAYHPRHNQSWGGGTPVPAGGGGYLSPSQDREYPHPQKGHGTRGWEGTWDQRLGYPPGLDWQTKLILLPSFILRVRAVKMGHIWYSLNLVWCDSKLVNILVDNYLISSTITLLHGLTCPPRLVFVPHPRIEGDIPGVSEVDQR